MSDKDLALKIMNDARKTTGGQPRPPLEWDDLLACLAESWAQQNASANKMQHSPPQNREGQGENLYAGMPQGSFEAAARAWVEEKSEYDGRPIDYDFAKCGHYTQCVWPSTTKVGMGLARGSNGWVYVCARYSPQGNVIGQSAH